MVVRRAQLHERWEVDGDGSVLVEMRHLETALLLTAKARRDARVRWTEDAEAPPVGGRRPSGRGRLKVVDGQAS